MAKNNNSKLSTLNFIRFLYDFKTFNSKLSEKNLIIFTLGLLSILTVMSAVITLIAETGVSLGNSLLVTLIGIPLFLFIIYILVYLFLSAFEKLKKPFLEGFLVFSSMFLTFIIIMNVLRSLLYFVSNRMILLFISLLLAIYMIYILVVFVLNISNYYKISWQRVLVCLILLNLIVIDIFILQYFIELISVFT